MSVNKIMEKKRAKAQNSRDRLAKRARAARAKAAARKKIFALVVLLLIVLVVAAMTNTLPNFINNRIQADKMETPTTVREGKIKSLYMLAAFYSYTFREEDALRVYDEICNLVNGFSISEFTKDREAALNKRLQNQKNIKRGRLSGPPFTIADSDVLYYSKAIYDAGQLLEHSRSRQVTVNLYRHLYQADFLASSKSGRVGEIKNKPFPNPDCPARDDPEVSQRVENSIARFEGRI